MTSWVPGAAGSGNDDDHLPYGIFSTGTLEPRVGVRIGRSVLDIASLARREHHSWAGLLETGALNPFLAAGPAVWQEVRTLASAAVTEAARRPVAEPHLHALSEVELHLPFEVADYVDFYASEHHATAVGRLLRPDSDPLPANWRHLPIGYHGRAGTVLPSGTPIVRPSGQRKDRDDPGPTFGPTQRLDIEAEVGFVVGVGSRLSYPVASGAFSDHIFGICLVNDWSARDIQAWETFPLGPFLGKSFATSIANWVTPLAALQAARTSPPPRRAALLDYLADDPAQPWGLDLELAVTWNGTVVSRPPFASMYFTGPQMLAHLTVNGASIRTGDLFASGTVSGPDSEQAGSFLELSRGGRRQIMLDAAGGDAGTSRTFLLDGDTVTISGSAPATGGGRLRLGEVSGTIAPARV